MKSLLVFTGMFGAFGCLASNIPLHERGLRVGGEFRTMVRPIPKSRALVFSSSARPGQAGVTTDVSTGKFYQLNTAIAGQIGYGRVTFRVGPTISYHFGGSEKGPGTLRPKDEVGLGWMVEGEYALTDSLSIPGGYDNSSTKLMFTPPAPFLPETRSVAKVNYDHFYGGIRYQPSWFGFMATFGGLQPTIKRNAAIPSAFARADTKFEFSLGVLANFSWTKTK